MAKESLDDIANKARFVKRTNDEKKIKLPKKKAKLIIKEKTQPEKNQDHFTHLENL